MTSSQDTSTRPLSLDRLDRTILDALQRDAQQSLDSLAERIGLSRNACWRRVKRLEADGAIVGRVALLDPKRLGLGLNVVVLIRTSRHDPEWLDAFRRAVRETPEIVGAHRTSGDVDYVLRLRVADVASYDAVYQRLIARVPLSDVSASFVMEDLVDTHRVPLTV